MLIHGSQLDVWLHAGKHCTLSLKIIKLINIRHINLNFISVLSVFSICMFKYPYFFLVCKNHQKQRTMDHFRAIFDDKF